MVWLIVRALAWGLWISFLAGAAAGTVILPVLYTPFGAIAGLVVGVVPTVLATAVVAGFAARHRPLTDPDAFYAGLLRIFRVLRDLLVAVGVGLVAVGIRAQLTQDGSDFDGSMGGMVIYSLWLGVGPCLAATLVMWRMLPRAAVSLTLTFVRRSGWGSPEAGDSQVGEPPERVFPEGAS